MPRVGVDIVGDASSFLRALTTSAKATQVFTADVQKMSATVSASASEQVAASVRSTEALKLQALEYRKIAAAAQAGSAEQVAAANLATTAEARLARQMGITVAASTRLSGHTRHLGRDFERVGRGALSGTGLVRGFTRSLAFASGGFLAFEGVTRFLTDSVAAAREAIVAQKSLAAQMAASGESFDANRARIEKASVSYGKFGFQNDEVVAAMTVLERGTGSINQSIQLLGVTADLARAKGIGLAQASTILAKVFGGQETALRRAVPGLSKHAHGMDLIREAMRKLAGQAAANTTEDQKFAATLHNTEEIIGNALLPTLNKYLTSLGDWLQKMNQSGKLQKDLVPVTKNLGDAFTFLATAIGAAADAYAKYRDITGKAPGGQRGFLSTLLSGTIFAQFKDFMKRARELDKAFGFGDPSRPPGKFIPGQGSGPVYGPPVPARPIIPESISGAVRIGPTIQQRNAAFDAAISRQLGRVQDITSVTGQIGRLQQIAGLIQKRINVTKDITRKLNLEDTLLGVFRQIKDGRVQLQQDAIDALSLNVDRAGLTATLNDDIAALQGVNAGLAQQQKLYGYTVDRERQIIGNLGAIASLRQQQADKIKQQREAAKQQRQAAIEVARGWLEFAVERAEDTGKKSKILRALHALEAWQKALIKQQGRTLENARALWETRKKIRDLNKKDTDPLAGLMQVSSKQLAGILGVGLGLGPGGRRILGANIAAAEIQPVHVHVNIDGREVAGVVTKHQARSSRRTAKQTSGFRG